MARVCRYCSRVSDTGDGFVACHDRGACTYECADRAACQHATPSRPCTICGRPVPRVACPLLYDAVPSCADSVACHGAMRAGREAAALAELPAAYARLVQDVTGHGRVLWYDMLFSKNDATVVLAVLQTHLREWYRLEVLEVLPVPRFDQYTVHIRPRYTSTFSLLLRKVDTRHFRALLHGVGPPGFALPAPATPASVAQVLLRVVAARDALVFDMTFGRALPLPPDVVHLIRDMLLAGSSE
jgi:hypothetical protein